MRHYQTSDNRSDHRNTMQPQLGNNAGNGNRNNAYNNSYSRNTPHNRNNANSNSRLNQQNKQQIKTHNQPETQFYNDESFEAAAERNKTDHNGNRSNTPGQLAGDPSGLIQSILKFIPPGIYNRETKKILGVLTAEDLLLVALIIMLADSKDNDDTALLIALVYILMG